MSVSDLTGAVPIDVAVIGGGPAGLAAATTLKQAGIRRVILLEREDAAGGIPRHCGHPPFGLREFHRILRGPDYARRLVARAQRHGVEIHCRTTVATALPGGTLELITSTGLVRIAARRVILATGLREMSRAGRLISGARAQGILNTGAAQSMIYLKGLRPFRNPVILGSELVAFSAIMTCRHAGIHPVAMVEPAARITARWPARIYPLLHRIPLLTGTQLAAINGNGRVSSVRLVGPGGEARNLDCDGVIVSGRFMPDATLARMGHLAIDAATGGPLIDQWGRCSDPAYFATGNLLRPVETAGWSWVEGRHTGEWVAADLARGLPLGPADLCVATQGPQLGYVMPQRIYTRTAPTGMAQLQLRVSRPVHGMMEALHQDRTIWQQKINTRPERRILLPLNQVVPKGANGELLLRIRQTGTHTAP